MKIRKYLVIKISFKTFDAKKNQGKHYTIHVAMWVDNQFTVYI